MFGWWKWSIRNFKSTNRSLRGVIWLGLEWEVEANKPIKIGKKNAHLYFGKTFGCYLVLPVLEKDKFGLWRIKVRCLECGCERFIKPATLWKRNECTCETDMNRSTAQFTKNPQKRRPKLFLDDLADIWSSVVEAGRKARERWTTTT